MSGGLFLKRRMLPCPRTFDIFGCTYGHILDHCGSVRPNRFWENLQKVKAQKAILPSVEVVCVGEFLRGRMIKAGYSGGNITVVPNFSDIESREKVDRPSGPPRFLALGRLERLKGFDWLLRSFAQVASTASLVIAGQGNEEGNLRSLSEELGIQDRVEFVGWTVGTKKVELIESARAVIVPSIWHETFGLVAVEAAAFGIPVIASNSGELPFIIENGYNGLVAEAGNVGQLAAAIDRMASNAALAEDMGRNNRLKYLRLYTAKAHIEKLSEVYGRAMRRAASSLDQGASE